MQDIHMASSMQRSTVTMHAAGQRRATPAAAARCRSRSSRSVQVKALTVVNEQVTLPTATGSMLCQVC